jgi:manganese transport system permease protein
MEFIDILLAPLAYPFMLKAILVSSAVGLTCALLSCFLILKAWSLLGDAISHAVLPGVVLAYILGIPFSIGALVFAMLAVVIIGAVKRNTKIKEDAVMGIVFTTLFALGLILISRTASDVDLAHVLFGYVLGISNSEAIFTVVASAIISILIIAFSRTLLLFCFDPMHAQSIGIPVRFVHYGLLALLAVTITSSLQTVGIILVIAMLITPGSTAFLLTKRFPPMLVIACITSVISSIIGAYLSYYIDISTGGAIVFIQGMIFTGVFMYTLIKRPYRPTTVAETA